MAQPQRPDASNLGAVGAAISAAVLIAVPIAQHFEGYRGRAYYDPAHILTQCYGETRDVDPARIYSKDECAVKLRTRMARDYAPVIARCLPQLVPLERRYVFGALLDASYNAGPVAVCQSRMARSIKAGNWVGACKGFYGWYTTARDRKTGRRTQFPGLEARREVEAKVCKQSDPAGLSEPASPGTGLFSDATPPIRFQNSRYGVSINFVDDVTDPQACGDAGPGHVFIACRRPGEGVFMPNPCAFDDQRYAHVMCHELAHVNGWSAYHEL